MVTYDSHTMGKLIIQDWNVIAGYPDVPLLYILTPQQAATLVALCPPQKWLTRWDNPPDQDYLDQFVAETMFNLMNPITCAMLQACLSELFEAQTTEITNILTNINNYGTSNPGVPMTGGELAQNLAGGTNPSCNLNILWAQCLALVQYTNRSIVDILEKVEAATNINELAALVDGVPLLGWIAEFFGSELMTDTINYFQEAIQESYDAQYTEAVEYELACGLFCLSQLGCDISVAGIYDFVFDRVQAIVPDNPAEFIDMIEMLAGIDFDGTNVVDLMFWFCWGGVKLASFAVGEPITTAALENITALAVNDANNDWEALCGDCPPECPVWQFGNNGGWVWVEGADYSDGWKRSVAGHIQGSLEATSITGVTTIDFKFDVSPFIVVSAALVVVTNTGTYSINTFSGPPEDSHLFLTISATDVISDIFLQVDEVAPDSGQFELISGTLCP